MPENNGKANTVLSFSFVFLGVLKRILCHWAHFLGGKITYIHFKENKRNRNEIIEQGGYHDPVGTIHVCQSLSYSSTGKSERPALPSIVGKALAAF